MHTYIRNVIIKIISSCFASKKILYKYVTIIILLKNQTLLRTLILVNDNIIYIVSSGSGCSNDAVVVV